MSKRIEDMTDAEINEAKRRLLEKLSKNPAASEAQPKPKFVHSERVYEDEPEGQR